MSCLLQRYRYYSHPHLLFPQAMDFLLEVNKAFEIEYLNVKKKHITTKLNFITTPGINATTFDTLRYHFMI
jgi:hypothetical protein